MARSATTWVKGESGNLRGRPRRGSALADMLRAELDRTDSAGVPHKEALVSALVEAACEGDLRAIALIFDRLEGRPAQRHEVGGPDAGPILLGAHIGDEERLDMLRRALAQHEGVGAV